MPNFEDLEKLFKNDRAGLIKLIDLATDELMHFRAFIQNIDLVNTSTEKNLRKEAHKLRGLLQTLHLEQIDNYIINVIEKRDIEQNMQLLLSRLDLSISSLNNYKVNLNNIE